MKVAIVQTLSGASPAANLEIIRAETASAVAAGAELIVFPEAMMCRFGGPSLSEIAEPIDGPWATVVHEIAAAHRATILVGMFTPASGGRVRNTLLVAGGANASYDKIHLYDAFGFRESDAVEPGDDPVVFTLDGVSIGVATCYDVRFPELFRQLASRGAEIIVVSASWGSGAGKLAQWELLTRARALDSTAFVVACDQADPASVQRGDEVGAPTGVGGSALISPTGVELLRMGASARTVVVDVDTAEVARVRKALPVLQNARLLT